MGMSFNMPRPQILNTITVRIAAKANGQLTAEFEIATGARDRPIQTIIGPVTTGGRNLMTLAIPTNLIIAAITR